MEVQPLRKDLFERAKELGITSIALHFSGGSDEGFLNMEFGGDVDVPAEFQNEIDTWAFEAYDYGGTGDGTEYGDDIEYDLVKMTATSQSWCHVAEYGDSSEGVFSITE